MNNLPEWAHLISESSDWTWQEGQLVHRDAIGSQKPERALSPLYRWMVRHCYANHNDSKKVRNKIAELLRQLESAPSWGLNLGSGLTSLHPKLINLDIGSGDTVQIVARGQLLPFKSNSLALVISQEVIEHLPQPAVTIREVLRVL